MRFAKQVWPGETLTFTAVVTGKREEDGDDLVDLDAEGRQPGRRGEAHRERDRAVAP